MCMEPRESTVPGLREVVELFQRYASRTQDVESNSISDLLGWIETGGLEERDESKEELKRRGLSGKY